MENFRKEEVVARVLGGQSNIPDQVRPQFDVLVRGWAHYAETGETPEEAYHMMRAFYVMSRGSIEKAVNQMMAELFPPQPVDVAGTIFADEIGRVGQDAIIATLRRDGLYRFETRIPDAMIDEIMEGMAADGFPKSPLGASRVAYQEPGLVALEPVRRLALDRGLYAIAQEYLGCQPAFDSVFAWKSAVYENDPDEQRFSAQQYHFDKDRMNWLAAFVYLSDVGPDSGPHTCVTGSHRHKPADLWRDGRLTDAQVHAGYDPAAIQEITGPRGTIFLEDTSGFHKGTTPRAHERHIMQITWDDTLFGNTYDRIPPDDPAWRDFIAEADFGSRFLLRAQTGRA